MNGMTIRFTQARVIGGGSAINAQIYTRGNALDYDEWRQMGCAGWSYDDVLPYFRKAEDNDTYDNRYHGKGGPLGFDGLILGADAEVGDLGHGGVGGSVDTRTL